MPDDTETPQPPAASPTSQQPIRTARPVPTVAQVPQSASAAPVVGEVPSDLLAKILADAAQLSGVDAAAIIVQKAEAVEWSDSSLGCPQPGMAYMQVITPGYQVVLAAGAATYDYHANARGRFVLCKK